MGKIEYMTSVQPSAKAARNRSIEVPANHVVLVLRPEEWAVLSDVCDQELGYRHGGWRQAFRESVINKVHAVRDQLLP